MKVKGGESPRFKVRTQQSKDTSHPLKGKATGCQVPKTGWGLYVLAHYGQGEALSSRPTLPLSAGILAPISDVFCISFKPQNPWELVGDIQ